MFIQKETTFFGLNATHKNRQEKTKTIIFQRTKSEKRWGEKHIFPLPHFQTVLERTEFGQAKPESPNISTPKRESRSDKDIPFP